VAGLEPSLFFAMVRVGLSPLTILRVALFVTRAHSHQNELSSQEMSGESSSKSRAFANAPHFEGAVLEGGFVAVDADGEA
jgi:hypothetical protein